jgi:DNA-binding CsgD family transcriptional regulator
MSGADLPGATVELFERAQELRSIDHALRQAQAGNGSALVIEGPAGIGKTSLLAAAHALAERHTMAVLAARGHELEEHFPYGIVRQLFERPVEEKSGADLLAGAAQLAGAVVLGADHSSASAEPQDAALGHLHGLYWLTVNLSQRAPLLITVDDAQLADGPSLRFLLHLTRRLEGVATALLVSIRPGEKSSSSDLLAQLLLEPHLGTVRPGPLGQATIAHLVAAGLGRPPDEEFVTACQSATGGVPFLVHELVSALHEDGIEPTPERSVRVRGLGPGTVARATLGRLRRSSAGAVSLTRAISVLGRDATLPRAASLGALDGERALDALDALVAAEVIDRGPRLEFVHPIVRAAIYDEIPPGTRSALHLQAAGLLAAEGAEIDAVAAQLLASEPTGSEDVVAQLREAARLALARAAPADAFAYLTRALREGGGRSQTAELTFELAGAAAFSGQPSTLEHYREARRLAEDPVLRGRISLGLARLLIYTGEADEAAAVTEQALAELEEREPELTLRLERIRAGAAAYDPRQVHTFDRRLPVLRRLADADGQASGTLALLLACVGAWRSEDPDAVIELVRRGWYRGRVLEGPVDDLTLLQGIGGAVIVDDLILARQLTDELLAKARARGSPYAYIGGTIYAGWIAARAGRLAPAEAEFRAALDPIEEHAMLFGVPSLLWFASDVTLERGVAELADLAETTTLGPLAGTGSDALFLEARGKIRHAAGRTEEGIADLRHAGEIYRPLGFRNPSASSWRSTLALMLRDDDPGEARRLAAEELQDAARSGQPRGLGVAHRALGLLEPGPAARAHLEMAVRVLDGSPARLEHARALIELGAAIRRAREPRAAREPLRSGLDLAVACGATRLADHARTELTASGARPRRPRATGRDALTASELRVARLAAEGRTNTEVAQALFVTAKTVDTHLSHAYAKLGISSRRELAAALEAAAD